MHLYRGCGATVPDTFQNELANLMMETKWKVAKHNDNLGTKADKGKSVMLFQVYEKVCSLMMESEDDEYIFDQCFLTLDWNLIAQSDNVVHSHMNHLAWRDDSLFYYMLRSKGDQTLAYLCKPICSPHLSCSSTCKRNTSKSNCDKRIELIQEVGPLSEIQ